MSRADPPGFDTAGPGSVAPQVAELGRQRRVVAEAVFAVAVFRQDAQVLQDPLVANNG